MYIVQDYSVLYNNTVRPVTRDGWLAFYSHVKSPGMTASFHLEERPRFCNCSDSVVFFVIGFLYNCMCHRKLWIFYTVKVYLII
jgi:hypothetical protein